TIIESGLDIPNANTILINDAQNYGLSDLHQLRGRVGRSNKQAFCYLLSPPLTSLTAEARKRLQALEQFSDLGSGINIAMRDLDIRGAGDILGAEQSGFISDIGYEMYQKILTEAVNELKENEFKELYKDEKSEIIVSDCQIETDLEILIPDEYITNIAERLALYKELDSIETEEKLQNFEINLIDRFGPIPQSIVELLNTIRLRWIAKELGFEKLVLKSDRMACFFIANQDSDYFQSSVFSSILSYIQQNPQKCRIKENKNRLSMLFTNIDSIKSALSTITPIKEISDKNKKSS
ncbi:MAG: TRCF domain-containing protein, partial [Bacteroidota bacterium]|nr:TRCF domain-containing protein [Bacteroidota bacterium]